MITASPAKVETRPPLAPENGQNGQQQGSSFYSKNRTMLLQIGRTDLRLISPDTKQVGRCGRNIINIIIISIDFVLWLQVLLNKNFREISHCARGQEAGEHFGFICK